MRYAVGGLAACLIALVQASSAQQFEMLGVVPNVLLVIVIAWLVVRGPDDVLPMAGVAGVLIGLIGVQTPGLALLAMVLAVAAGALVRELHVVHSDFVLAALLTLGGSMIYELVVLAGAMAAGAALEPAAALRYAVLPAAAVNLSLLPPIFFVMRLAGAPPRRRRYA
jgi:rod shape-determining protein MreD